MNEEIQKVGHPSPDISGHDLPGEAGRMAYPSAPLPCLLLTGLYGLGLIFSFYLFWLYFTNGDTSFCALFHSDCIGVELSEYGTVADFPVASFGLAYFTLQLVLTLASLRQRLAISPLSLCCNLLAVGGSLYFIFIMSTVLHQSCIVCYGVHLVNLGSLWVHVRARRNRRKSHPEADIAASRQNRPVACSGLMVALLSALLLFAAANLFLSRQQLADERGKSSQNLSYQRFLYQTSVAREFSIEPKDQVLGKVQALHQIVLIYKHSCRFCERARKQLSEAVQQHPAAVYLIMKNHEDIPAARLKELGVEHVPAVFIDGRRAAGWDMPGFLEQFSEDCGC